jgi:hypothetical protein
VGGAVRFGLIMQDPDNPKSMSELHLDPTAAAYANAVELRLHGDVTDWFSWTANFNALLNGNAYGRAGTGAATLFTFGNVGVEDLIAQVKLANEFQIWGGRLLVPSDRANFAGPFFMIPWNYPGFYLRNAAPIGPMEGFNGRNNGMTVWGNVADDKFKYFLGVYGLDQGFPAGAPAGAAPFYSARISYTLQGSEPGYFGSSTYYGEKNIVTIGLGGQFQKDGSTDTSVTPPGKANTYIGMADIFAEENLGGAGTLTMEGQFYAFNKGYNFGNGDGIFSPREAFYLGLAYLTPENIGIGKLQPHVRWQQTIDPAWTVIDAGLAYVMKAYDARVLLNYQHIDTGTTGGSGGGISNAIQLGVQLQK